MASVSRTILACFRRDAEACLDGNARAGFRRSLEALHDRLHELADSHNGVDLQGQLNRVRDEYYSRYVAHAEQYLRETIRHDEDRRNAIAMARVMARPECRTPGSWFVERIARTWAKVAKAETPGALCRLLGRKGLAEAGRRSRICLRGIYHDVVGEPAPDESPAKALAVTPTKAPPVEITVPLLRMPSTQSATATGANRPAVARPRLAHSSKPTKLPPSPAVLEQRAFRSVQAHFHI